MGDADFEGEEEEAEVEGADLDDDWGLDEEEEPAAP